MTPQEQEQLVEDLEQSLDRLQALYNQYFMGIEKIEPLVQRKAVERKIQALRREQVRNTAVRFRMQTQIQKFNTQSTYWRRICRQIEEGTYQRDVARAQRRGDHRDMAEKASQALGELGEGREPRAVELDAEAREALDEPFGEGGREAPPPSGQIDQLDDPFADPAGPDPAAADGASGRTDPDKTPVPEVGTGVHEYHERLIRDAREKGDDDDDELSAFFSRRSVTPPPPPSKRESPVPPPPPGSGAFEPPRPQPPKAHGGREDRPAAVPRPRKAPARQPAAQASAQSRSAESASASAAAIDEKRKRAIYRSYLAARKKTGEPVEKITYGKISRTLDKQLASKKRIDDFKVVIRDGKAVIKTVRKR
ncbi:MAG: MXAN_5187 C-terminal domain-containing protein [Polyangia bacterium]